MSFDILGKDIAVLFILAVIFGIATYFYVLHKGKKEKRTASAEDKIMEEMTLEGKSKAPIKIDISNCGNDTATNIAISINRIEIPQISFLLPNEIKSVYIGMVDISNHKITLVTGYEFPIEKSNALHMNIQEIKNTNNKWIIPIIITTDNK